jgi:hypothetical protein
MNFRDIPADLKQYAPLNIVYSPHSESHVKGMSETHEFALYLGVWEESSLSVCNFTVIDSKGIQRPLSPEQIPLEEILRIEKI